MLPLPHQMVEFMSLELPGVFLNQDMNATRLAELILFVLNRTTTGTDAKVFEALLKLDLQSTMKKYLTHFLKALDKVSQSSILAPIVGILLNLFNQPSPKFPISKTLVSINGLNVDSVKYLSSFDWKKGTIGEIGCLLLQLFQMTPT